MAGAAGVGPATGEAVRHHLCAFGQGKSLHKGTLQVIVEHLRSRLPPT